MNKLRNWGAATVGSLALLSTSVHAAVPAAVSTAIADIGTDGATVAGVILLAVVTIFAIKFLRKGL